MKRKLLSVLLVIALLVSMISGCSKQDGKGKTAGMTIRRPRKRRQMAKQREAQKLLRNR